MKYLKSVHFFGVSAVSKVIQRQTGPYSHSAMFVGREEQVFIQKMIGDKKLDNITLMEQWPHSGKIDSWMDYNNFSGHTPGTEYEIWGLKMPQLDWEYCMAHYVKSCEIKRPYDWAGIMHFRLKSVKEDPDKTFCSEEYITPVAKILGWDTVKPFNVHPTMAVNLTQAAGGRILQKGIV